MVSQAHPVSISSFPFSTKWTDALHSSIQVMVSLSYLTKFLWSYCLQRTLTSYEENSHKTEHGKKEYIATMEAAIKCIDKLKAKGAQGEISPLLIQLCLLISYKSSRHPLE